MSKIIKKLIVYISRKFLNDTHCRFVFYDEAINREDIKINPYQLPDQAEIFWGMMGRDRVIDEILKVRGEEKHDSEK